MCFSGSCCQLDTMTYAGTEQRSSMSRLDFVRDRVDKILMPHHVITKGAFSVVDVVLLSSGLGATLPVPRLTLTTLSTRLLQLGQYARVSDTRIGDILPRFASCIVSGETDGDPDYRPTYLHPTRSPTRTAVTFEPTSSTIPTPSCPNPHPSVRSWPSVPHTPE